MLSWQDDLVRFPDEAKVGPGNENYREKSKGLKLSKIKEGGRGKGLSIND